MHTIDNSPHGNSMMVGIDKDPKPDMDDYYKCDVCNTLNHIDDIEDGLCRECWAKDRHRFYCLADPQHDEIEMVGIPTKCPVCDSLFIGHSTTKVTRWIHEAQKASQ